MLILLYPGLISIHAIRLTLLPNAAILLAVLILTVGINDALSYLFGHWIGRTTAGIFPVSPRKSVIGYLGGAIGALGIIPVAGLLFPHVFNGALIYRYALGSIVIIGANLGDLAESAIKRAIGFKNSGRLIPGRGGIMDSIDSCLFATPIFGWFYLLWFGV